MGSYGRSGKALWNILSTADIKVGLVGWPGAFPAEPVRGFNVVSYEKYYLQFKYQEQTEMLNFPPFLLDETSSFFHPENEFVAEDFIRFLNVEQGEESVLQGMNLLSMAKAYSTDRTVAELWLHMAEKYRPRVGFVWLGGCDVARSSFFHLINMDPDEFEAAAPDLWKRVEPVYTALRGIDRDFMVFTDEMVGRILETTSDNTIIIVLSEHGYLMQKVEPGWMPGSQEELYSDTGIFAIAGPGVDAGIKLGNVRQYDVVPTALALLGLPKADDMDGEVLKKAFDAGRSAGFPAEEIDTYESPGFKPERTQPGKAIDAELLDRLRSLGYID